MQKISDTFCPAKWDEVYVSYEMNYAYACCKSRPTEFHENPLEYIDKERSALLDGVQDTSCEYCWRLERAGQTSLRHEYLKKFDKKNFESYANNTQQPKFVQVSIGNECNFQCTYCNPKFSSKWEEDVSKQKYKIFTDRFFYEVKDKQKDEKLNVYVKNSFMVTYVLLITTGTITIIEALRTQNPTIRHVLNLETCISKKPVE